MRFTLDVEQVGNSHKAHIQTEGFSLRLTRPTAGEAIARIGQVIQEVAPILASEPVTALDLEPDARIEPLREDIFERKVAIDGDSDNMRKLLDYAVQQAKEVKLTYTDRKDNTTTRSVAPVEVRWAGSSDTPRRALIANDAQQDGKTFYLDKIDRAEVI